MSQPAVLLIHGQPGRARDWQRVAAAIGPRARLLAPDRPGWDGRSAPGGLAANAAAALAALDAHEIPRATVVGHSFGGAVAAWIATHAPERVESLVLAAPSANVASLYWLDHFLASPVAGQLTSAAALGAMGLGLAAPPLRRAAGRMLGLEEHVLRGAGRLFLDPARWRAFWLDQRALVEELPALERRLGEISCPTTVVAGSADWVVPLSSARQLAEQIPPAALVLVDGAGHLLPLRHAEQLAELILGAERGAGPR